MRAKHTYVTKDNAGVTNYFEIHINVQLLPTYTTAATSNNTC